MKLGLKGLGLHGLGYRIRVLKKLELKSLGFYFHRLQRPRVKEIRIKGFLITVLLIVYKRISVFSYCYETAKNLNSMNDTFMKSGF